MDGKQHVFVGMSGGVDSSLSAALLVEQGYRVTGVYMKNWSEDLPGFQCPWLEDYEDAMRVAAQLGIDFKMYDFRDEYRQKVVDYMIEGYKQGLTPNPDIMCNQEIKFKLFLETAVEDGADMIATGHYARVVRDKIAKPTKNSYLYRAKDGNKDQSYFLYRVTDEALSKTIFPLGELEKPVVRAAAKQRKLATADKKDSQGICFIGDVRIEEFLVQYVSAKPGAIVDTASEKPIGTHKGALFYTIGQRHGLGLGGGLPYYVVGKDMAKNEVYVTSDLQNDSLWTQELKLASAHWIQGPPAQGDQYTVRIRHRGELLPCRVRSSGDQATVSLNEPVRAAASGQSAVVYDNDKVLGGGIITIAT